MARAKTRERARKKMKVKRCIRRCLTYKKKGASYQFATTEQPNFYLDPWPKLYCKSLNGKQRSNRQKGKGIQESASTGNTGLRSCKRNGIYLVGNIRNFNHYISQSNSGDNWNLKRPNTSYAQPNE